MPNTIRTGTILIKEGTRLPEGLEVESDAYVPGWRLVKNLNAQGLDRNIQVARGNCFSFADEMNVTVFGLDQQKTARRAVGQLLASLKSGEFNSLEITQVVSSASKRFLGVTYLTVSAHCRHIQECISPSARFPNEGNPQLPFSGAVGAGRGNRERQPLEEMVTKGIVLIWSS